MSVPTALPWRGRGQECGQAGRHRTAKEKVSWSRDGRERWAAKVSVHVGLGTRLLPTWGSGSLVARPPLTAFFAAVGKKTTFFHGCEKAARGGLGTRLGHGHCFLLQLSQCTSAIAGAHNPKGRSVKLVYVC